MREPHDGGVAERGVVAAGRLGGVSRTADLGGPVHYVDFGGSAGAPRVVLVHGLSGSHLNWCLLAPRLVAEVRVLAVDLVGFGLTHPKGRAATVQSAAIMLDRFVREVAEALAILVGNSMGGMASIMEVAVPGTGRRARRKVQAGRPPGERPGIRTKAQMTGSQVVG
jgi:Alpha/beta hydrolase family